LILVAAQAAIFIAVFSQTVMLTPFSDMVAWLERYAEFKVGGGLLDYLMALHNEHRPVTIRLLTAIDVEVFGARGVAFIVAALSALGGTLALVLNELRGAGEERLSPAVMLAIALILTVPIAMDCSIPINSLYPLTLFFVVAAIIAATHGGVGSAVIAALLASFTNATGLVIWPVLFLIAASRARLPWIGAVLALGVIVCGSFVLGQGQSSSNTAARSMWDAISYWPLFLGLPWSRSIALQLPAGIFGIGLMAVALSFTACANRRDNLQALAVAFVLFSLACSVLAAFGRSGLHEPFPPVRYTMFMLPIHLALLFFALRRKLLSEPIALAVLVVLVAQQALSGYMAVQTARSLGVPVGL
jgi:hypothetical protein